MTSRRADAVYPVCRSLLGGKAWEEVLRLCAEAIDDFAGCLARLGPSPAVPPFLPDLARIEEALHRARAAAKDIPGEVAAFTINPTLQVLQLSWSGLASLAAGGERGAPAEGDELAMIWCDPADGKARVEVPDELDLLAIKVTLEEIDPEEAAAEAGRSSGAVDVARWRAVRRGVLLAPPSKIRRDGTAWPAAAACDEKFLVSQGFTLQWHITQACDLHCRHCYDRTSRKAVPYEQAVAILDDLLLFCRRRNVSGHVTFTGGNPLLHPRFTDLYREASERGFTLSILGNPASREDLEKIRAIEKPTNYQVSLEGLEKTNDGIRGEGHYRSVMEFLPLLRELAIPSMVMLTLTDRNIDEIIPLARVLEGAVDSFFFNRLAAVGEGADLTLPSRERYAAFLEEYLALAGQSEIAGLKDNLFNIVLEEKGLESFGGCTGFGCGAAFNFLTVLAEGEAHACRKFPSPLGNVLEAGLEGLYESEAARRYREGCRSCRDCRLRPLCGGCLAVSFGQGLDHLADRDPHCFLKEG